MSAIIHSLGIQWSSLIAQMINFGILVFVLQRYLYKPLLRVIDERKALIASSIEKVRQIDMQKEEIDTARAAILRKADEEGGALLERAKSEAEALRTEIEKVAKLQADQILKKGMQQLENERATMAHDMQDKLAHAIVHSAEKILRREFSKEDQESFEAELKKNLPSMLS